MPCVRRPGFEQSAGAERTVRKRRRRGVRVEREVGLHDLDALRGLGVSLTATIYFVAIKYRAQERHHSERDEKYDVIPKRKLLPQCVMYGNEHDNQNPNESRDRTAIAIGDPSDNPTRAERRQSSKE